MLIITFIILLCKIYFGGLALNLDMTIDSVILTTVGLILLLLSPAYFFQVKARKIYLYALDFLVTFFIIADLLYFRYFATPISIYVFMQSANLTDLGPSIFYLFQWSDLLFIPDLILLPLLYFFRFSSVNTSRLLAVSGLTLGLFLASYYPVHDLRQYGNGEMHRYTANDTFYAYGPLGFHFVDLIFFVKDQNIQLTPEIRTAIQDWFDTKQKQTVANDITVYQNIGEGKNLIVIQVESLQNFVIGKTVDNQEITPNLNKLLQNSLYFPHFYPQTIGGNSSDAELIINTSLFPLEKGSTFFVHPNNVYDSLPKLLKNKGYDTLAIHADEANFWNRHQVYPNLGFQKYYSLEKLQMTEEIGMGLSDEAMFKQSIPILQASKMPFYALIITLTSHYPYYMPANKSFLELNSPLANSHIGNYLQSIHYTDYAIGQFLDELDQNGMLEKSIIAIYGDHDGLFKKDLHEIEKVFALQEIDDEKWIQEYLPVPLIIYGHGLPGKTVNTYGGQIDFLPTISHLMGIDKCNLPHAMGKNLLTNITNYALIPGGDYNEEPVRVTAEGIDFSLNEFDRETLKVADLMIKTNFCARH